MISSNGFKTKPVVLLIMKTIIVSMAFFVTCAVTSALADEGTPAKMDPGFKKVYQVKEVDLKVVREGGTIEITALGTVRTGGWKSPELRPYNIDHPKDGIYTLVFIAKAPTGIVNMMVTPVKSEPYAWKNYPSDLKGVRVIAETNKIEKLLVGTDKKAK